VCFVAMRRMHSISQVACPVELQHVRSDRVADCLNDRQTTPDAHASRTTSARVAISTLSPQSRRSCYTPLACVFTALHALSAPTIIDRTARRSSRDDHKIIAAHFSPMTTHAACVGALTITGMIDASATRRPSMPCTRRCASTTAARSDAGPMRHVPAA